MTKPRSKMDISVLYVEDEAVTRTRLVALLQREVKQVFSAGDGREGLEQYLRLRPDVVVTDIRMPEMDGIAMTREIRKADPAAEIIITSAHNDASLLLGAIDAGVAGYLLKPVDARELMTSIGKVSERKRLEQALRRSERHFRSLVEQAPEALLVYERESGRISECNQQACDLLFLQRQKLLALTIAQTEVFNSPGQTAKIHAELKTTSAVTAESFLRRQDGSMVPVETRIGLLEHTEPQLVIIHIRDISKRKRAELERELLIGDLQKAISEIKTLRGIIPICSSCKKIRDDQGFWKQVEAYVAERTGAEFSHGICPDCVARLYPDYQDKQEPGSLPGT